MVVVVFEAALGGFLYYNDFRITYAPNLENSWDAISAFAAWAGVIVAIVSVVASFLAVWYAIQVPKQIADRQDKIALFEKRFECFQLFKQCYVLYKRSKDGEGIKDIKEQCYYMLEIEKPTDLTKESFKSKLSHFERLLHQMEFLFPEIKEEDVSQLYTSLLVYIGDILTEEKFDKAKQNYIGTMKKFRSKYSSVIWDSMTILNIK